MSAEAQEHPASSARHLVAVAEADDGNSCAEVLAPAFAASPSNSAPTTSRGPQSVPTATAVRPASASACEPSAATGTVTTTASYGSQNVTSYGREVT